MQNKAPALPGLEDIYVTLMLDPSIGESKTRISQNGRMAVKDRHN
jgi:hypothetical protein